MKSAHTAINNFHFNQQQTVRRLKHFGVFWLDMVKTIHEYIRACPKCQAIPHIKYATLFWVAVLPKWSEYLVEYIKHRTFPKKMSKQRQRAIQKESEDYVLIQDHLYKWGKDGNLFICEEESKYVAILEQAHARLACGHFSGETTAKAILMAGI